MKMISFALLAALSLTACKKQDDAGAAAGSGSATATTPAAPDCAAAIGHSMDLSKADMMKMPGATPALIAKMQDLGLQHCKDDKWPADAIKCMTDAKTEADSTTCYNKLSPDQQSKMNNAVMAMMTPPAPAAGSDTGSGSAAPAPAAGSGSGSGS